MPRAFSPATAEQVIAAVEAVVVSPSQSVDAELVATFLDLPRDQAEAALQLAADIGFISDNSSLYTPANPLCRFVATANQAYKAAALRILLEAYQPFVVFRERLIATTQVDTAANQTKTLLVLDAHREKIKETLISLGTYGQALIAEGGGRYNVPSETSVHPLAVLAQACVDAATAEVRILQMIGPDVASELSRTEVIVPLADAMLRASRDDSSGAVQTAGNAVESYIVSFCSQNTVNIVGATGLNAKLDRIDRDNKLPKKLIFVGKYLGHIRNAADHGIDSDVGASWTIRNSTAIEYVSVSCSFISSAEARRLGRSPEI